MMGNEINQESMDENAYLGAICVNSTWHFYLDRGGRFRWAIDLRNSDLANVPKERANLLNVQKQDVKKYVSLFETELQLSQIKNMTGKTQITFVINFDEKLFVDLGGEEAESFAIYKLVPDDWKSILDRDASFYIPNEIRRLWISKNVHSAGKTTIYPYTSVAAIRYDSNWSFFFENPYMWVCNFTLFMAENNRLNWPRDTIYGDWRTNLPYVDETNAISYLEELQNCKIEYDEIPSLAYYLSPSNQYVVDQLLEDERHQDASKIARPELSVVINFDEKLYIQRPAYENRIRLKVAPDAKFAPSEWVCHEDVTYKYIPQNLRDLWK